MQIALCATKQTITKLWEDNIDKTEHTKNVFNGEEELLAYLSSNHQQVDLLCLEDIWVDENEEELKELVIALKSWYPNLEIFILSQDPSFIKGKELLGLGIKGYGNARMQKVHFKDALECIKRGDVWVYPEFIQNMIKIINTSEPKPQNDALSSLTFREKQIAILVHEGHTNKEIADFLNITLRTVKAHTGSIYEKLQVKDRIALVLLLNNH